MSNMEKEFYLEVFNYKYNCYLPVEILDKLDDNIVKVKCYVYKNQVINGESVRVLGETFETCTSWKSIRAIKK